MFLPTHWNIDLFKTIIRHSTALYSVKDKRANLCVLFYYSCDILYFYWYCFQSRYLNIIHFHPRLRATKFWNANSLLTASQFFFERGKIFLSADDFNENPTVPTNFDLSYRYALSNFRSWMGTSIVDVPPTHTIKYRSISTWSWNCQNTSQFQSSPLLLLLHLLLPLLLQLASLLPLPSDNLAIAFAVALTIAIDIDHTLRCTACISDRRLFIALPTRFRCLHAYANRFYFLRPELSCFAPNPTPTSYHQSDHLSTISIVPSNVPSNIPSNVPSNATSNFPSSVPSNHRAKQAVGCTKQRA